jgi:RNA polymerase sigma factor (sigma-70 family)
MPDTFRRQLDEHYRAHANRLVKQYTSATKSQHDAEDIVHNAYVEACEYWHTIDNLKDWMGAKVSRCFKAQLRDKINRGGVTVSIEDIHEEPGEDMFTDDWIAVRDAIARMSEFPPGRKRILAMFFLEQMTQPDIAEAMGVTLKTVENTVGRFRQEL